ncbi:type II toxin-antitoxin system RelE/ParE family toxin [Candidatus Nitrospira neomarina]|uniref:type II toxin-antitoxin system RelE/ParE family toxin n=1 Tax=Candidatus Nitrospira neomarina TaxID=3020899 RepID=UPI0035E3E998
MVVKLTDRVHYDLQEIERYSLQRWGRKRANRYLADIQTALSLLQEDPDLLRHDSNISTSL